MNAKDRFPEHLLNLPVSDRIAYFKGKTVIHPKLLEAFERLEASLNEPEGSAIIFLYGPTGVGKTTLLERTIEKLTPQFLKENQENQGRILFAGFEAPAPDFRNFDWKDLYVRALESLKDPLVDRSAHLFARTNGPHNTKARLRLMLERNLQHRRPKLFYIDEAQNLGKVSNSKRYQDQADCIKSLSNLGGVPILLVGTYELIYLRNLSAQLCRRSTEVHYPRYRLNVEGDKKGFKNVVATFQRHLPLELEPSLTENWEFCYERSLGCIGILKNWLSRTLAGTLHKQSNSKTITLADLEEYAYPINTCSHMLMEIHQEEQILEESSSQDDLRIALGLMPDPNLKSETQAGNTPKPKAQRQQRVGEPNPKRRNVGGGQNAS